MSFGPDQKLQAPWLASLDTSTGTVAELARQGNWIYIYICMYVCVYIHMRVCMCTYIYIYMYVYICFLFWESLCESLNDFGFVVCCFV